jgi:WD40 repeat protein/serine/threonine protein kinase/tetratricopeptide (TPR) repeat protein
MSRDAAGSVVSAISLLSSIHIWADPLLPELVEQVTRRLQVGEAIDVDALVAGHPERADAIRRLMPALRELALLGSARSDGAAGGEPALPIVAGSERRLGDFRLVREIGRGGMGIVYEAIQDSLGRRVALKVVQTAAALDARALQRFQIEAQAAACLNHPHIVPVHTVGNSDGIPYYAMQLIEGASFAQLIGDLRRIASVEATDVSEAISPLAACLLSGRFDIASDGPGEVGAESDSMPIKIQSPSPAAHSPGKKAGESGTGAIRLASFFRSVARAGIQAAEALEYAHGQGIIHRDVKPANLLLDRRGSLWVTDFGLARLPGDSGLTQTGELIGTLRYISPEQATGKRALVDRRTDIYSLGVTLYEILGLKPAIGAEDAPDVVRRIAEEEPVTLRTISPAVPPDLATVVTKAMAKEPAARYQTAQHLADDLRRFLEGRPVSARPEPLWRQAARWARRRPALSSLLVLVQLLGIALLGLCGWSYRQISRDAENARRRAEREFRSSIEARRMAAALELERGIALASDRQVSRGLLSMLRAANDAPDEAGNLRRAALANLADWGAQIPRPRAILPSSSPIAAVQVSPNGRIVAVGCDDGQLVLWDADTGLRLDSSPTTHISFRMIEFHPSGRLLATCGSDDRAQLWDVTPLRVRGEPFPLACPVKWTPFDPGGRVVLTVKADGIVQFRDPYGARPPGPPFRATISGQGGHDLRGAIFAPSGDRIMTFGLDGSARLWATATGQLVLPPLRHGGDVLAAAFRRDGRRLATSADSRIRIWDTEAGRQIAETAIAPPGYVHVDFSVDGRRIVAVGHDHVTRLFDSETGLIQGWPMPTVGAVDGFAQSPDGRLIATYGPDGVVRFFDARTGRALGPVLEHGSRVIKLIFRPDGRGLVTASRDGAARVWDIMPMVAPGRDVPLASAVLTAEFSPDGRLLATDGTDGTARVFDTATGRAVLPPLLRATNRVLVARFSPDGTRLATGGDDSLIQLWDVASGKPAGPPMAQPAWVVNARFSPDGRRLLVGTAGGTARLWDLTTFRPIGSPLLHPVTFGHEIWHVGFDSGGRVAITGTALSDAPEATLGIWDAATGQQLAPFGRFPETITQIAVGGGPSGPIYVVEGGRVHVLDLRSLDKSLPPFGQRVQAIALFPDGKSLLAAGSDRTARLWDVATGRPVGPVLKHDDTVLGVAISPDGATLLTLAGDRLWFWDAATGIPLGAPREHDGLARRNSTDDRMQIGFSPDGRVAFSAGDSVMLWHVPGSLGLFGVDPARSERWAGDLTGMDLDADGSVRMFSAAEWCQRIVAPGNAETHDGTSAALWHDRLASESERKGHAYTALWHLDGMIAVAPSEWDLHLRRARARRLAGDREAAAAVAKARELGPGERVRTWEAHEAFDQAKDARSLGRWDTVRAQLARLRERTGANSVLARRIADADLRMGNLAAAESELAAAVESQGAAIIDSTDYLETCCRLAALRVHNGHSNLVCGTSRCLLEWAGTKPAPAIAYLVAWHCALCPEGAIDPMALVKMADTALHSAPSYYRPRLLVGLGASLYRAARYDDAVARLEEAEAGSSEHQPQVMAFLAMANQARGHRAEALRWLERLRSRAPNSSSNEDSAWNELEIEVLTGEALAVVLLDSVFPADPFAR